MGLPVGRTILQALLHRTQVEEQLALRLRRGHLDHAPVLQDVFVDLGLDPVHRIAHQTHALVRVEALDRLHQAHVAFLDQVAMRQPVAQVLARDRDHQAQVRQHQLAGSFDIASLAQPSRRRQFLFEREQRHAVGRRNVGVQVAERRHQRPRVTQRQRSDQRFVHGKLRHAESPFVPQILALSTFECLCAIRTSFYAIGPAGGLSCRKAAASVGRRCAAAPERHDAARQRSAGARARLVVDAGPATRRTRGALLERPRRFRRGAGRAPACARQRPERCIAAAAGARLRQQPARLGGLGGRARRNPPGGAARSARRRPERRRSDRPVHRRARHGAAAGLDGPARPAKRRPDRAFDGRPAGLAFRGGPPGARAQARAGGARWLCQPGH